MAVNPEGPGPGEQVDREAAESVATRLGQLSSLQPKRVPSNTVLVCCVCWSCRGAKWRSGERLVWSVG
ncbi:unnamed protein product [Clonostachys solani]|uniref:Uncharacterized protein n=1 Tax=Clonostachys solani TaxID=160281 RepID=A0A9N9Z5T6_9HYPO|nr:unnamed protein product [Clonostachys solani]